MLNIFGHWSLVIRFRVAVAVSKPPQSSPPLSLSELHRSSSRLFQRGVFASSVIQVSATLRATYFFISKNLLGKVGDQRNTLELLNTSPHPYIPPRLVPPPSPHPPPAPPVQAAAGERPLVQARRFGCDPLVAGDDHLVEASFGTARTGGGAGRAPSRRKPVWETGACTWGICFGSSSVKPNRPTTG